MKYTVGFNWDNNLFDKINFSEVESVYGGIGSAVIGGGRAPLVIKAVTDEEIKQSVELAHEHNMDFDFTVNSGCLANKEFTKKGHEEIITYLEWIEGLGVDSITVTLPSIIQIARKYTPKLKIKVSTFQRIASVEVAKKYESLGVDAIMITENCNRDFKLIESIRSAVDCKLVLLANVGCLYNCHNAHSHIVSSSHSCDKDMEQTIFTTIPFSAECVMNKLRDITEFIKIRYIRPEDVKIYEDLGIDLLKLADRHTKTEIIEQRVKAYVNRSYDGNLMDLMGQKSDRKTDNINQEEFGRLLSFSEEGKKKIFEYFNYFNFALSDLIYIDNKKFPDNFLNGYRNKDCVKTDCNNCGYCKRVCEQVIRVPQPELLEAAKANMAELKEKMYSGEILY